METLIKGYESLTCPDPIGELITSPINKTARPRYCCIIAPFTRGYCVCNASEVQMLGSLGISAITVSIVKTYVHLAVVRNPVRCSDKCICRSTVNAYRQLRLSDK